VCTSICLPLVSPCVAPTLHAARPRRIEASDLQVACRVAPGGVEPPHADSKVVQELETEGACNESRCKLQRDAAICGEAETSLYAQSHARPGPRAARRRSATGDPKPPGRVP
jgi:hypothetical protein